VLDHLTISIITHRRTYRNFHHNISDFINAEDSQISINRAMCGHLDAYDGDVIEAFKKNSTLAWRKSAAALRRTRR